MHHCFLIFEIFNLTSDLIPKNLEQLVVFWARRKIRDRFDLIMDSSNQKFLFGRCLYFSKISDIIVF